MSKKSVLSNGATILRLRGDKGWTQEKLAQEARCSKKTVENAEAGRPIHASTLRAIAEALEVEPRDLRAAPPPTATPVAGGAGDVASVSQAPPAGGPAGAPVRVRGAAADAASASFAVDVAAARAGAAPLLSCGSFIVPDVTPASEVSRLLEEMAASVEHSARDFAAKRRTLRRLQVHLAQLRWRQTQDDAQLFRELSEACRRETEVFQDSLLKIRAVEEEIRGVKEAIAALARSEERRVGTKATG